MATVTSRPWTLMAVLAHPDDESLGFGGTLAQYASAGGVTALVTATRGDRGRYGHARPGDAAHPGAAALGRVRESELLAAAATLGVRDVSVLSYGDQQVDQTEPGQIASLIRYDAATGGLFVSGGTMANMVCFLAARAAKASWNVREHGVAGSAQRLRVYCSTETHTWIQKAADLSGLGTSAIRWIPLDAALRMDVGRLRAQIDADRAAGDLPFLVIGTAGSVSTGAIDRLDELHTICAEHGLWFHVDAAYGGFANALPDAPGDLRGLAHADSVAVDPHKWLYAPLEAGCVLVRDVESLRAAFAYHPPYYRFGESATNFLDFGVQNSRGFRALKVWLALKHVGASGYRAMIADDIRLSHTLAQAVAQHPDLELISQNLSITVFRYVPAGLARAPRRARARATTGRAQSTGARPPPARRRSVRLERRRGGPLRTPGLRRQLSYD